MATKCRALKRMRYKGQKLEPGQEFLVKDKDAKLFSLAKLATILETNVQKESKDAEAPEVKEKEEVKEDEPKADNPEPGKEDGAGEENLWDKTKLELRAICDKQGIEYKPGDTKGYLIDMITDKSRYHRRDMRSED